MRAVRKAIHGNDYILLLTLAAAKEKEATNSASAFLGSEQKRADFCEMLFEFEQVALLFGHFEALVDELDSRFRVFTVSASSAAAAESKGCVMPSP